MSQNDISKSKGGCFLALKALNGDMYFVRDVKDKNRKGLLGFVGGTIEYSETPSEAGMREASEELGIRFFKNTTPRLIVHRTPPVDVDTLAPTWLFDVGCHWTTHLIREPVHLADIENHMILQKSEVSEVVRISQGDILNNVEKWKSEFYTGHFKMLGWLMHRMQYAINEPIFAMMKEDPWETKILK